MLLLKVPYVPEGLEAIIFTADGDMRQALNNLQATYSGFQFVNQANVFKVRINYDLYFPQFVIGFVEIYGWFQVCDQPHPLHVKNMVRNVIEGNFDEACSGLKQLYDLGYSPTDIITTLFRIIKSYDMAEYLKLEFMKVATNLFAYTHTHTHTCIKYLTDTVFKLQETGFAHMRICDGVGSYLQLCGLLAKLSLVRETAKAV